MRVASYCDARTTTVLARAVVVVRAGVAGDAARSLAGAR